jgi:hypothetical protein
MIGLIRSGWRRRGMLALLAAGIAAALMALDRAIKLDEGSKRHLRKQLHEAREMPRRLLT